MLTPASSGRIISLSGVDCSGKTTQLDRLEAALRAEGARVIRVWHRPGYSGWLNRLRDILRRVRPGALPSSKQPEARAAAFAGKGVSRSWILMALVDMVLHYGLRLRLLRWAGYTVLADRYVADGRLDLAFRFPEMAFERWLVWRAAATVFVRADLGLLLNLPHGEMIARMKAKQEPFPDPPEVRDARYQAYQRLAACGEIVVVDAEGTIDEVHRRVMRSLRGSCG